MKCVLVIGLMAALAYPNGASAKVVDVASGGFTLKHSIDVRKSPAEAYADFTKVAAWWDGQHTYSGRAENLTLDARANGCFCERLPNQGSLTHLTVLYAQPGKLLRFSGGLGPLQSMAVTGVMTLEFTAQGERSTITFTYSVGGYAPGGFEKLAPVVDQVMTGQLGRYQRYVNAGSPAER